MRLFVTSLFAALLPVLQPTASAQTPSAVQLDKSSIRFVSKQMNVPVEGRFKKFTAGIAFDAKKPEATRAEFEVDLASIDLGSPEAETEVKRKLWFNTDAFPKAKFTVASVKPLGADKYDVTGALTIKGIELKVASTASVKTDAAGVSTAEGKFPIKRLQYKIGEAQWADTETVADEVEVRYKLVFSNKK